METLVAITNVDKPKNRDERRKARKQAHLGPTHDPIRQQGRDPEHVFDAAAWFATPQPCDRSRATNRRRMYHETYATSSGHTFDQHYEQLSSIAREFEDAGINLGWGDCAAPGAANVRDSVEAEIDRRYGAGLLYSDHRRRQAKRNST